MQHVHHFFHSGPAQLLESRTDVLPWFSIAQQCIDQQTSCFAHSVPRLVKTRCYVIAFFSPFSLTLCIVRNKIHRKGMQFPFPFQPSEAIAVKVWGLHNMRKCGKMCICHKLQEDKQSLLHLYLTHHPRAQHSLSVSITIRKWYHPRLFDIKLLLPLSGTQQKLKIDL